jgi:undecaprenyl-diphosphatase
MDFAGLSLMGLLQGLTEFLPVSSSGHLAVFQYFFGDTANSLTVPVFLHLGTVVSVLVYYRKDLLELVGNSCREILKKDLAGSSVKTLLLIILANIPAGIAGVFFKDSIEHLFADIRYVAGFLLVTALVLIFAGTRKEGRKGLDNMSAGDALLIGLFQMCAILPGISRAGATVSAALIRGFRSSDSARFSMFIMLPAVTGAAVLELKDTAAASVDILPLLSGTLIAFLSGYLALTVLIKSLARRNFHYFSIYLILAAGLIFLNI